MKKQRRRQKRGDSLLLALRPGLSSMRRRMSEHLEWMRVRQYSAGTVQGRADALSVFAHWCEERGIQTPEEVTRALLERYQRHLFYYRKTNGAPLSPGTQHGRMAGLRGYFRWLVRDGHLSANPAADVDMPRKTRLSLPWVLTPKEVEAVLAQPDMATASGLRDRAILEVLYSTGMRRMEACQLTVHSVRREGGLVFIRQGKGKKDRVVPIGERALHWLGLYVEQARSLLVVPPDPGALFLGEMGEALHPNRLTHLVRGYVRRSGVSAKGACHLLRHAMATLMLEGGADVRFVQEMLGHSSLEATQIYTHVSVRKLKDIHAATHPAAKLSQPEVQELLSSLAAEVAEESEASEGAP